MGDNRDTLRNARTTTVRSPAAAKSIDAAIAAVRSKTDWIPITPVPSDALKPRFEHPHYGAPTGIWEYRDQAGALLGFICRYRNGEGGKEIVPLLWCRNQRTGERKWHRVQFPVPRPLYGLEQLDGARSTLPVLIVEGEKCVDAARTMLADRFVIVTWPGGARAIKKAGWAPLAGRDVIIWPDCDAQTNKHGAIRPAAEQPGIQAAEQIAEILLDADHPAASVRIVDIPAPGEVDGGWDIADAIDVDAWSVEQLLALLDERTRLVVAKAKPAHDGARASSTSRAVTAQERSSALFVCDSRGGLKDCRENVIYVLSSDPAWQGVLGADTFAKRIVVRKPSPLGQAIGAEWTSDDDVALGLWLYEQRQLQIRSIDTLAVAARYVAGLSQFHPLRDFLTDLQWDGEPRLDGWVSKYLGADDSPYHRLVGRFFLINMIRRVFEPGCVMRSVPVLEGPQDKGKSRSLHALARPWFSDTPFKVGDKDSFQQIQGIWIYEISELESFTRAEATAVKAFVSSTEDNFRAPYERQNERHLRQTAFAATTNASEYLKDWTGNTRFWPLTCGKRIDLDGLAAARDQLLAEALALYRDGARAFPTAVEQSELFEPQQDRRMMTHPWRDLVFEFLNPANGRRDEVTVSELLVDCIGVKPDRMNPQGGEAQRVGQILHALNWSKVHASHCGRRVWKWVRPALEVHAGNVDDAIPF